MTLYQVVLNAVDYRSPVFSTRDEAVAIVKKYTSFLKKRGFFITKETEDNVAGTSSDWNETTNRMWIREIEVGKIPESWTLFW